MRALIEFPRNVFWAGHACFARANGLGHPCFAHRVVNQHAQNRDHYNPADTAVTRRRRHHRGPGGRLRWRTLRAARARRGVDGVHRLGRGRGAGGRQQQQRRVTVCTVLVCGLQSGVVSNGFMLVWTQVFRARLTGGRHARFAVTHETLLVGGLV